MREDVEYYFICLGFSILMVESLSFLFLLGTGFVLVHFKKNVFFFLLLFVGHLSVCCFCLN